MASTCTSFSSSVRETVTLIEGEQHDAWQWIGSSSLLSPDVKRVQKGTPGSPMRMRESAGGSGAASLPRYQQL